MHATIFTCTCAAVMRARGTRWCGTHPTGSRCRGAIHPKCGQALWCANNPRQRSGPHLHIALLGSSSGAFGDPCQSVVRLPSPDGWPDGAAEFRFGAVPSHVLRVPADRVGQPLAHGRVFLQQLQTLGYNANPVLRELRVPSPDVPAPSISRSHNPSRGFVRAIAPRGASHTSTRAPKS